MKIMNIDTDCTDNGVGIRTAIYIAGCSHHCKGCHNQESWNPNRGHNFDIDELIQIIEENPLADVTITGGDGLTFQYEDTFHLIKAIKEHTDKNIWLYTGFTFEYLLEQKKEILPYIDVIVDGRFESSMKDLNLLFRGSSNQRIIDVHRSIQKGKLVMWGQTHKN
jgi:anaerobic ribonucleoside-triphosphate reductase activating protein